MLASAQTATHWESAFLRIMAGWRVMHLQRTIFPPTVSDLGVSFCLVVTSITEPFHASTSEESYRAAELALPVNELGIVTIDADVSAYAHRLD